MEQIKINTLIIHENFQYAILGKSSYGKPSISELRRRIPCQCGIKNACSIGVLNSMHILIRLKTLEDYVNMLSTKTFYVKEKEIFARCGHSSGIPDLNQTWRQ